MLWLDTLRLSTELTGAPERCVHVGDRDSDIYELYCLSEELRTGFLVRSRVDRLAEDGGITVSWGRARVFQRLSCTFTRNTASCAAGSAVNPAANPAGSPPILQRGSTGCAPRPPPSD
jgi:hypothetical protein